LKRDNDFKMLLRPNDLIILDRGFRDVVTEIKDEYQLKVKM
jgi:hypothetical protein